MRVLTSVVLLALLAGCGEPIKGVDEDAKATKMQARDAVNAAEEAAKRIDEASRPGADDPENSQQQN
jgi:hypothetical protein